MQKLLQKSQGTAVWVSPNGGEDRFVVGSLGGSIDDDFNTSAKIELFGINNTFKSVKKIGSYSLDTAFTCISHMVMNEKEYIIGGTELGDVSFVPLEIFTDESKAEEIKTFSPNASGVSVIDVFSSPIDQHTCALYGDAAYLIDPISGNQLTTINPRSGAFTSGAFNKRVAPVYATCCSDGSVCVWDSRKRGPTMALQGRSSTVGIDWSPLQGTVLAIWCANGNGAYNDSLEIFDLRKKDRPIASYSAQRLSCSVSFGSTAGEESVYRKYVSWTVTEEEKGTQSIATPSGVFIGKPQPNSSHLAPGSSGGSNTLFNDTIVSYEMCLPCTSAAASTPGERAANSFDNDTPSSPKCIVQAMGHNVLVSTPGDEESQEKTGSSSGFITLCHFNHNINKRDRYAYATTTHSIKALKSVVGDNEPMKEKAEALVTSFSKVNNKEGAVALAKDIVRVMRKEKTDFGILWETMALLYGVGDLAGGKEGAAGQGQGVSKSPRMSLLEYIYPKVLEPESVINLEEDSNGETESKGKEVEGKKEPSQQQPEDYVDVLLRYLIKGKISRFLSVIATSCSELSEIDIPSFAIPCLAALGALMLPLTMKKKDNLTSSVGDEGVTANDIADVLLQSMEMKKKTTPSKKETERLSQLVVACKYIRAVMDTKDRDNNSISSGVVSPSEFLVSLPVDLQLALQISYAEHIDVPKQQGGEKTATELTKETVVPLVINNNIDELVQLLERECILSGGNDRHVAKGKLYEAFCVAYILEMMHRASTAAIGRCPFLARVFCSISSAKFNTNRVVEPLVSKNSFPRQEEEKKEPKSINEGVAPTGQQPNQMPHQQSSTGTSTNIFNTAPTVAQPMATTMTATAATTTTTTVTTSSNTVGIPPTSRQPPTQYTVPTSSIPMMPTTTVSLQGPMAGRSDTRGSPSMSPGGLSDLVARDATGTLGRLQTAVEAHSTHKSYAIVSKKLPAIFKAFVDNTTFAACLTELVLNPSADLGSVTKRHSAVLGDEGGALIRKHQMDFRLLQQMLQ